MPWGNVHVENSEKQNKIKRDEQNKSFKKEKKKKKNENKKKQKNEIKSSQLNGADIKKKKRDSNFMCYVTN